MAKKSATVNTTASTNATPAVPPKSLKQKLGWSFSGLERVPSSPAPGNPAFVKYYLLAYNVLSALGWSYILILTVLHIFNLDGSSSKTHIATSVPSALSRLLSSVPFFKSPTPGISPTIQSRLPIYLQPIYRRSTTTYALQTCATFEVLHVLLGWVRSPMQTTAMQVSSRLWIVWGIAQQFDVARTSPLYTSAVLAWSITEVVRYSFYASSLLGYESSILLYLRYTMFYVLYPLGAGSEAFLIYATLPFSSTVPNLKSLSGWTAPEYGRAGLFLIWWPSLYQMYTHMMAQRRKVIGSPRPKSKTN
ncbi:tyrosine phosphatase-like protein [Mycena sp. CBHHK59/15]|nr:tyrosine phosphatase-like protein [Mycena sp. CBHHK59/15]